MRRTGRAHGAGHVTHDAVCCMLMTARRSAPLELDKELLALLQSHDLHGKVCRITAKACVLKDAAPLQFVAAQLREMATHERWVTANHWRSGYATKIQARQRGIAARARVRQLKIDRTLLARQPVCMGLGCPEKKYLREGLCPKCRKKAKRGTLIMKSY